MKAWDEVRPPTAATEQTLDYSCNGMRATVDGPGEAADFTISGTVNDFQNSSQHIKQATVRVFKTVADVISDTSFADAMTDDSGQFTGLKIPAMTPRVQFKITGPKIDPDQDPIPTVQLQMKPMPGMPLDSLVSVSRFTAMAVAGIVGVFWDNQNTGLLGGSVRDCVNHPVSGAQLFGTQNGGPISDESIYYFSDQRLPVKHNTQYFTSTNGIFGLLNVAPGMVKVQAKGRMAAGEAPILVSDEEVPVFANSLTVVRSWGRTFS
jgi:hypothetical protein